MKTITLIAAMSKNRVIGKEQQLPWHIPEDLKRFKALTLGKPVIMGRKTFESIGKPLPNRQNILITRQANFTAKGCEISASLEQAIALANSDDIMIIGGGEIYRQALPIANTLELTLIDEHIEGDTFFPEWDETHWYEVFSEAHLSPCHYRFVTLKKR